MSKFCTKCGKELVEGTKFCTNCGAEIANENTQPESTNQEKVANEVNQKVNQQVNQQQNYNQNFNYQTNSYAQNDTEEKVRATVKKIFGCEINNNDNYFKAEKKRSSCIYAIIGAISVALVMIPFYDKWFWFEDGFEKTLLHIMSVLSVVAIIAAVLICIFSLIKYFSYNKEVKAYRTANPTLPKNGVNLKVTLPVMAAALVACLILSPIMEDIDTKAYNVYLDQSSSKSDSTQYSDLVEKCDYGLQFKYTPEEYLKEYNKVANSKISIKSADIEKGDVINSYFWKLEKYDLFISTCSDTNRIQMITLSPPANTDDYREFYNGVIDVFSIIDDEIDADKIKEMLVNAIHTEGYKNHYYKKGVDYRVERIGTIISVYMRAETEDAVEDDEKIAGESGDKQSSSSSSSKSSSGKSSTSNKSSTNSKSTSSNNTATDFVIVGGSSNVHILSSGNNYSVDCPYCGYNSGPVGTTDFLSEVSKHKPGEKKLLVVR